MVTEEGSGVASKGRLLGVEGLRPQTETPMTRALMTCLKNRQRFPSRE